MVIITKVKEMQVNGKKQHAPHINTRDVSAEDSSPIFCLCDWAVKCGFKWRGVVECAGEIQRSANFAAFAECGIQSAYVMVHSTLDLGSFIVKLNEIKLNN